jgi:hypothetical protein
LQSKYLSELQDIAALFQKKKDLVQMADVDALRVQSFSGMDFGLNEFLLFHGANAVLSTMIVHPP